MRRSLKLLTVVAGIAVVAGCGASNADSPSPPTPATAPAHTNPLAGQTFYSDPQDPAQQQYMQLLAQGNTQAARAIAPLGTTPSSTWLAGSPQDAGTVARVSAAAAAAHRLPVFVMYNIPGRNCGGFSAGGATNGQVYTAWFHDDAAALQGPAVFILEPDTIPELVNGCYTGQTQHVQDTLSLLNDEVHTLKYHAGVRVYIDAGNSGWVTNPADLVPDLQAAGIGAADGVALNVANFLPTSAEVQYGQTLAKLLGGKGVMIDTSRNGHPMGNNPCNPPGAALGARPTTDTHQMYIDAYFWGKLVGTSDGNCQGGPAAGEWWSADAQGLAQGNAP